MNVLFSGLAFVFLVFGGVREVGFEFFPPEFGAVAEFPGLGSLVTKVIEEGGGV